MFAVECLAKRMDNPQCEQQSGVDDDMTRILILLLQLRCRLHDKKESKYVFLESLLHYIRRKKNRNQFPDTVLLPVFSKKEGADLLIEDNGQFFLINLTATDDCYSLNLLQEKYEGRYIKLSFKEDIVDWMETEVINILPLMNYHIAKTIYSFYKCLIKMYNLDNRLENRFQIILDTELQKRRKMAEEEITIFEKEEKKSLCSHLMKVLHRTFAP